MEDTVKQTIEMPRTLWERVSDWRHERRLKSKKEAVIIILEAGLDALGETKPARAKGAK